MENINLRQDASAIRYMHHAAMDSNTAEIFRILQNMIRLGTVAEVDHAAPPRVRVQSGKLLTGWLSWGAGRAGETRKWDPITEGEQVMILSPNGDMAAGIVFPSIYSDANPAPSSSPSLHTTHYADGAVIEYDHDAHALVATLPAGGSAVLTAPASVIVKSQAITFDAPETTCTGNLTVQKKLTYQGGMAGSGGDGGVSANLDGDIKAGNISLQGHHHIEQGDGAPTSEAKS